MKPNLRNVDVVDLTTNNTTISTPFKTIIIIGDDAMDDAEILPMCEDFSETAPICEDSSADAEIAPVRDDSSRDEEIALTSSAEAGIAPNHNDSSGHEEIIPAREDSPTDAAIHCTRGAVEEEITRTKEEVLQLIAGYQESSKVLLRSMYDNSKVHLLNYGNFQEVLGTTMSKKRKYYEELGGLLREHEKQMKCTIV